MEQYLILLDDILTNGKKRPNRTGIPTLSVFGRQVRLDLNEGFPLLTTKKMFFKGVVHELLWFLQGSTNIQYLLNNGVHIWDEWADKNGEIGPMYGKQLRNWEKFNFNNVEGNYQKEYIDQIQKVIDLIKTDPDSRRICFSTWNPADLDKMVLNPCHSCFTQFYVFDNKLHCSTTQRSGDCFLGIPFNFASYALLTHMIAQVCDLQVGELVYSINDLHLYENSIEAAKEQLKRIPFPLPKLVLDPDIKKIDDFKFENIRCLNYQSHPAIKVSVAV